MQVRSKGILWELEVEYNEVGDVMRLILEIALEEISWLCQSAPKEHDGVSPSLTAMLQSLSESIRRGISAGVSDLGQAPVIHGIRFYPDTYDDIGPE